MIALLFSGQGAQRAGMGKSFYDESSAARAVFEAAEKMRPGTIRQCFEGSKEELSRTINTQPCLFCVDMAAAAAVTEAGIVPAAVSGFSLGELAALSFAGSYGFEDGLRIVMERAKLMDEAAESSHSSMVAALKLESAQVEALCKNFDGCYPVNYNCPGQTVVALKKDIVPEFSEAVKREGGRAVPLAVSGGFHSPFMDGAADEFLRELDNFSFSCPSIPVYANQTAQPHGGSKESIAAQINNPVRWRDTIENMTDAGIEIFIEVGIGKTLTGFVKSTVPNALALNVEDAQTLSEAISAIDERKSK